MLVGVVAGAAATLAVVGARLALRDENQTVPPGVSAVSNRDVCDWGYGPEARVYGIPDGRGIRCSIADGENVVLVRVGRGQLKDFCRDRAGNAGVVRGKGSEGLAWYCVPST